MRSNIQAACAALAVLIFMISSLLAQGSMVPAGLTNPQVTTFACSCTIDISTGIHNDGTKLNPGEMDPNWLLNTNAAGNRQATFGQATSIRIGSSPHRRVRFILFLRMFIV
ncbi:MAG: hypothetical protein ACKVS6_05905 [Planctomycetota bacterium]